MRDFPPSTTYAQVGRSIAQQVSINTSCQQELGSFVLRVLAAGAAGILTPFL